METERCNENPADIKAVRVRQLTEATSNDVMIDRRSEEVYVCSGKSARFRGDDHSSSSRGCGCEKDVIELGVAPMISVDERTTPSSTAALDQLCAILPCVLKNVDFYFLNNSVKN